MKALFSSIAAHRAAQGWRRTLLLSAATFAVSLLVTYCAGVRHQRAVDATARYDAAHAAIVDTIHVADTLIKHDTVRVAETKHTADRANAKLAAADSTFRAHVQVLSDTTVSIDHGAPTTEIPVALALPPIQLCPSAIAADTAAYHALEVLLADQTAKTVDETHRADLAEARITAIKGSRLGFKSGVLAGLTGAALLVWLF